MTEDTVAELDDLEPEEVEAPKRRRAGATLAQPAEAIPAEINSAFLEALPSSGRSARRWGSPAASTAPWAGSAAPMRPSEHAVAAQQPVEAALCALDRAVSTARDLAL